MNQKEKKSASLERTARRAERVTEKDRRNSISCHGISAPKNEPIPVYIFSQSHTDVKISDNQSSILDDLDDEIREVSEMYDRRLKKRNQPM